MTRPRLTRQQQQRLADEHRAFNRRLKQSHRHSEMVSFDQYLDQVFGRTARPPSTQDWTPPPAPYRRGTPAIPSLDTRSGQAASRPAPRYTGSVVTGICQTHKSNAVPITNSQQAVDIARMRR